MAHTMLENTLFRKIIVKSTAFHNLHNNNIFQRSSAPFAAMKGVPRPAKKMKQMGINEQTKKLKEAQNNLPREETEQEKESRLKEERRKLKQKRRKKNFRKLSQKAPEDLKPIAPKTEKKLYKRPQIGYNRVDKILGNFNFSGRKNMIKWMVRNRVTIKIGEETTEDGQVKEILQNARASDVTHPSLLRINGKPLNIETLPY